MLYKDKRGCIFIQMMDERFVQITSETRDKTVYGFIIHRRPNGVEGLTKMSEKEEQTFMNTFAEIVFEGSRLLQTKQKIFDRPL